MDSPCIVRNCRVTEEPIFAIAFSRRPHSLHPCCDPHIEVAKFVAEAFNESVIVRLTSSALGRVRIADKP